MGKAVLQGFRPVFQMPGIIMTRLMPVRRTYFTSAYIRGKKLSTIKGSISSQIAELKNDNGG